ncbi:MAG: hypothetical protein ACP5VE_11680 [Chthonomonadales bacterium]
MTTFRVFASRITFLAWALLLAASARSDIRDFPFTYDWQQPARNEKELELHGAYFGASNLQVHQIEMEWGITDRFSAAPYLVFHNGGGRGLHLDAVKLETRYQLGVYAPGRLLPGLYAEIEKAMDEPAELEAKLIVSRYDNAGNDLSLNYIVKRGLGKEGATTHAYSLAFAGSLRRTDARLGIELIHDLSTGRINAGPTIGFRPIPSVWLVAGYALPVNGRENNRGELRVIAEYQWF